jgi:FKBP-type peptidyl-prolyl cis-trans isomerase FklB
MKHLFTPLWVMMAALAALTACSETDDAASLEYQDWQNRNAAYHLSILQQAKDAVTQAQAAYGDDWEQHCDWRVLRTYAKTDDATPAATDSIPVKILHRGTGSGCPYYTDSVRVNYIGRFMPNPLADNEEDRTAGKIFTYTGLSKDSATVFSPTLCSPSTMLVSNTVEGFTTALLYMHIGDLWRVYIPQQMGYGLTATTNVPAGTVLVYDVELKGYYRTGTVAGTWK